MTNPSKEITVTETNQIPLTEDRLREWGFRWEQGNRI